MTQRQASALLAISGLFFQLLMAGFHIPPALAQSGLELADRSGQPANLQSPYRTIVICTINGLQTVTLDGNNQPLDGKSPAQWQGNSCPICPSLSSAILLGDSAIRPPLRQTLTDRLTTLQNFQLNGFHPDASLPRGPPLV